MTQFIFTIELSKRIQSENVHEPKERGPPWYASKEWDVRRVAGRESQAKSHVAIANHKEYYKRKVVASPNPSYDEFCESMYTRCSFVHQKCSNYALTNLLFGLCVSIWIIDTLATHLNPLFDLWNAVNEGKYPNSLFYCFHFETCIWIFQGVWGCVIRGPWKEEAPF